MAKEQDLQELVKKLSERVKDLEIQVKSLKAATAEVP
jgi:hypothetical protein